MLYSVGTRRFGGYIGSGSCALFKLCSGPARSGSGLTESPRSASKLPHIIDVADAMVSFTQENSNWHRVLLKLALVVPSERLAVWLLGKAAGSEPSRVR
jgi:hypothetical protein